MKFHIDRDELHEAVSWTARSLPARPQTPLLSGILIRTENGTLNLSSFDYEISAKIEVSADVSEPGTTVVSGRLLADICRSLPSAMVSVETEGSKLTLRCQNSQFTLPTMSVDEYPELPALPKSSGKIMGTEFAKAVSQVSTAASKEDSLPVLAGIKMEFDADRLTLLATDRYRLALRELTWNPAASDLSAATIVKAKTLSEVARSLGSAGELEISLSESKTAEGTESSGLIGFVSGGRQTTSLLVDGDYPKIRSLFPENSPIHAVIETQLLLETVNRVALVAERNSSIRLAFSAGQVHLDAGSGESAQASEVIDVVLNGEDITTAFNPHYLLEGLAAFDSKYVRFSFTSPPKPAMITAQAELEGEDSQDFRYLVMPVRLAQ